MKVGDLVLWQQHFSVVVDTFYSKVWRADNMGKNINWGMIEPEPFVNILVDGHLRALPVTDVTLVRSC